MNERIEKLESMFDECEAYEILSLCPANGVMAVYADDVEGGYELKAEPLTHIAVASCIKRRFENHQLVSEFELENTVVGIDFSDGYMQICNEAFNFAGLLQPGQDIERATGSLNRVRYPRSALKKKPE
jgi:hypothetical protein